MVWLMKVPRRAVTPGISKHLDFASPIQFEKRIATLTALH